MRSKLLLYILPVALVSFLLFGYSVQDNPNNDSAPALTENSRTLSLQLDTIPPVGFPLSHTIQLELFSNSGRKWRISRSYFLQREVLHEQMEQRSIVQI